MLAYKSLIAGLVAFVFLIGNAFAGDFGPAPADYQSAAPHYISTRLSEPGGAKIQVVSAPYRVYADIGRYRGVAAWAVDTRVSARLDNNAWTRPTRYTVVFVNGDPVALNGDIRRMTRL